MRVEMNTVILLDGKQLPFDVENNLFSFEQKGYHVYPMDTPLNVFRNEEKRASSTAIVKELHIKDKKTVIIYEVISLHSVN